MEVQPMALVIAAACTVLGGCDSDSDGNSGSGGSGSGGGSVSGLLSGETLPLANNGADTVRGQQPTVSNCTVSQGSETAAAAGTCPPSPVKRIALFVDSTSGTLMSCRYDPSTAALALLGWHEASAGPGTAAITLDTSASRAFTVAWDPVTATGTLTSFNIGPGGLVTAINSQQLSQEPLALALDQAGNTVYVLEQSAGSTPTTLTAFPIKLSTGRIGAAGAQLDMKTEHSALMYRSPNSDFVYIVDPLAGTVVPYNIGANVTTSRPMVAHAQFATGRGPIAMAITPNGQFGYVLNSVDTTVSVYTLAGGTAATVGPVATIPPPPGGKAQNLSSIVIDPSGQYLYVYDNANHIIQSFAINQPTGALTALATPFVKITALIDSRFPSLGVAGTRSASVLYLSGGSIISTWTINPSTGVLTAGKPATVVLNAAANISASAFGP